MWGVGSNKSYGKIVWVWKIDQIKQTLGGISPSPTDISKFIVVGFYF